MAIKLGITLANGLLDEFEALVGTGPLLQLRTGSPPADCATADSGTLVASMTLPSDFMAAASGGSKAKSGTWEDTSADNAGVIGHFRVKDSGGSTVHMQGTVTESGGGGDMIVDNTDVNAGQSISISTFTLSQSV